MIIRSRRSTPTPFLNQKYHDLLLSFDIQELYQLLIIPISQTLDTITGKITSRYVESLVLHTDIDIPFLQAR